MYNKLFNVLAVLTLFGVGFIAYTLPWVFDTDDTTETPHEANTSVLQASVQLAEGYHAPDVSKAIDKAAAIETAKGHISDALAIVEKIKAIEPEYIKLVYAGEFYTTMYAATVEQCGNDLGITASGRKVTDDPTCHTVAVDPAIIPLGSYLIIEGYEGIIFRADDTGSAINGYDIDIFTTSESESKTFNNVSGAKVWIIKD